MRLLVLGGTVFLGRHVVAAARAAGLTFRPVAQTVQDTLDWARRRLADYTWRAGLPAEREAEVLGARRATTYRAPKTVRAAPSTGRRGEGS